MDAAKKMQIKINTHEDVCRELNDTYARKNADYDDAFAKSFREYGMSMPCIRLEDKLNRLKALTVKCQTAQVNNESIEGTIKDLANYAIMTLVELKMMKEELNNAEGN